METMSANEKKRMEALDRKIEKLEDKVIQKRREYESVVAELQNLLDEKYPERKMEREKAELYDAYVKSGKSIEEVIALVTNPDVWDYV